MKEKSDYAHVLKRRASMLCVWVREIETLHDAGCGNLRLFNDNHVEAMDQLSCIVAMYLSAVKYQVCRKESGNSRDIYKCG